MIPSWLEKYGSHSGKLVWCVNEIYKRDIWPCRAKQSPLYGTYLVNLNKHRLRSLSFDSTEKRGKTYNFPRTGFGLLSNNGQEGLGPVGEPVILRGDQKQSSVSPEGTSSSVWPVINGAGVEEDTRAGKYLWDWQLNRYCRHTFVSTLKALDYFTPSQLQSSSLEINYLSLNNYF